MLNTADNGEWFTCIEKSAQEKMMKTEDMLKRNKKDFLLHI